MDRNYIFDLAGNRFDYTKLRQTQLQFMFYPFFFICAYGVLLYRDERSLGEYVNALMVCFFVLLLLDMVDLFSIVYQIKIFLLSQYILCAILLMFIMTLFRKINFVYSEFGQFYDHIIVEGNKWGIPIKRKKSDFGATFLSIVSHYFNFRKNTFAFLFLLLSISLNYVDVSLFLKLNITTVTFAIIILFFYISALNQKRTSSGNLLSSKKHS